MLGPDDTPKVIDQGADDTTNAVSIRHFFGRTAGVLKPLPAGISPRRRRFRPSPPHPGTGAAREFRIIVWTRFRSRNCAIAWSRAGRKPKTHGMRCLITGLMHVKL